MTNDSWEQELHQPLPIGRTLFSYGMTTLVFTLVGIALLPLLSILLVILYRGIPQLSWQVFVSLPAPEGTPNVPNGFANAIVGTLMMVGIASVLSIPFGVMTGIFLSEFGRASRVASFIRFIAVILSSVPSIVVGVFAYGVIVLATKKFSAVAGGFALSVIMLPIVTLTTEEALKLVPTQMRLASAALGGDRFQTTFRIAVASALPGITTGVLLAVARAAGETAPLLFTALSTQNWPPFASKLAELFKHPIGTETISVIKQIPETLLSQTPSLSVLIFNYASSPYTAQNKLAWTASLVLLGMVLLINILSRLVTHQPLKTR
jgi:phosphate transport system permease protein